MLSDIGLLLGIKKLYRHRVRVGNPPATLSILFKIPSLKFPHFEFVSSMRVSAYHAFKHLLTQLNQKPAFCPILGNLPFETPGAFR